MMNALPDPSPLKTARTIVVVGRGIFGICGAIECHRRFGKEYDVISVGGPLDSECSTQDISKITRGDYGNDDLYTRLHLTAIKRWKALERQWFGEQPGNTLFHWTGVSLLSRSKHPLPDESYEACSLETFRQLDPALAVSNCQVFHSEAEVQLSVNSSLRTFCSGYRNDLAGWIESGAVLQRLVQEAAQMGVIMVEGFCVKASNEGVQLSDGRYLSADEVVVCCGAWTPFLLPETSKLLRATAQPVFLFEPRAGSNSPETAWLGRDEGGPMSPLTLDMAKTGFYCFPFHRRAHLLKVGHHGEGYPLKEPVTTTTLRSLEAKVRKVEESRFSRFLDEISPAFSENWGVHTFRLCQYCDSLDSHFLVDRLSNGVVCAAGGSGHGFKFGMVIGELIADCVERKTNQDPVLQDAAARFRWRSIDPTSVSFEQARNRGRIDIDAQISEANL